MVRIWNTISFYDGAQYVEGACLSTDEMPTENIATGSKLTAVDTGDEYRFNEVSGKWAVPTPGT